MVSSGQDAAGELAGMLPAQPRHVLVVDDSKAQRRILAMQLERWGYRVTQAATGEEALCLCRDTAFEMVLSDWMMPGMSGLGLCKAFRALPHETYGYFILLTSKSDKTEIADGLEQGADDFLTKPVYPDELRARLRAGERILRMQGELVEKNRLVISMLDQLRKVYDELDRDLIEARKLQQTLMRERNRDFGAGTASMILRPSGHIGGDLVGCFEIGPGRIGMYSVDVSGHGVASAMMTARLAGLLSGASPEQNIALMTDAHGQRSAWPPETVASRLNRMMLEEVQVDQYFTLAYVEVDLSTGHVALVQAGHPHPAVLRNDGRVEYLGNGGLPIGLISGATFERLETWLFPGDRLLLISDGVTECPDPSGQELGEAGLTGILQRNAGLNSPDLLEALVWNLYGHSGGQDFPDDVSGILFHFKG